MNRLVVIGVCVLLALVTIINVVHTGCPDSISRAEFRHFIQEKEQEIQELKQKLNEAIKMRTEECADELKTRKEFFDQREHNIEEGGAVVYQPDSPQTTQLCPVYNHQDKRPLHLVYVTKPVPYQFGGEISEGVWIRDVLLSKLQRPVVMHYINESQKHDFFLNDSLVVSLFLKRDLYMTKARSLGYTNIGIYMLGDEKYEKDMTFAHKTDYVLRNYWNTKFDDEYTNVHWVPNGVKTCMGTHVGFTPSTLPLASQRSHLCNFLGSLRKDRKPMIEALQRAGIECMFKVGPWEGKGIQFPFMYRMAVEQSKFTLCPWGQNPETMRHYEALELGSIPVVRRWKDEHTDPLNVLSEDAGTPPFIIIDKWDELPPILRKYENSPQELDELQKKVITWWIQKKDHILTNVRNVIEDSFTKQHGDTGASAPLKPACVQQFL